MYQGNPHCMPIFALLIKKITNIPRYLDSPLFCIDGQVESILLLFLLITTLTVIKGYRD